MKSWLSTRNTYVDYGMRFVVISEKDEVLRISHAVMSELFDRRLALPQYAGRRIRWCEVVVSLKEGRAVAVQRFLSRYIHFDAHGVLDLDLRWPLLEVIVLRTINFACSRSGGASTRLAGFFLLSRF